MAFTVQLEGRFRAEAAERALEAVERRGLCAISLRRRALLRADFRGGVVGRAVHRRGESLQRLNELGDHRRDRLLSIRSGVPGVMWVALLGAGAVTIGFTFFFGARNARAQGLMIAGLSVTIGGEFFTTYAADGIIVATPTGSTAYAFSARGPIVSPELRCLLLIPVSPHMLFDRTLILHPQEGVRLDVQGEPPVELAIDGRTLGQLTAGDAVTCHAGEWPARLIVFERRHFHRMLKVKFQLPDR